MYLTQALTQKYGPYYVRSRNQRIRRGISYHLLIRQHPCCHYLRPRDGHRTYGYVAAE